MNKTKNKPNNKNNQISRDDSKNINRATKLTVNQSRSKKMFNLLSEKQIEKYNKWYVEEYSKQLLFEKMPNIKKTKVNIELGSIQRMNILLQIKYGIMYDSIDLIVVVFQIKDLYTSQSVNYGTVFFQMKDKKLSNTQNNLVPESISYDIAILYYSAMASFTSCDGEYKPQFSRYRLIIDAIKKYDTLWDDIDKYVIKIKNSRQWGINTIYFYPKTEQESKNINVEATIASENIRQKILVVAWFNAIYDKYTGIVGTHITENFTNIFYDPDNLIEDLKFMKTLEKKYSKNTLDIFHADLIHVSTNYRKLEIRYRLGFKMIPLNIKEVQDPIKLRYKPWREFLISNRCNDFIINSICPNFSVVLDWFYIKNSKKGLFDNKSQYVRLKHSELAKEILHMLYEAQRSTYFATEGIEEIIKNQANLKQWISTKFKKLNEKIEEPINYSTEEIIMSEVTLSFPSEFVGFTFGDTIHLIGQSKIYDAYLGYPLRESGYDYFAKYIFDLCYGLYCMNSKLGIIHGDFHLNNATIGLLYPLTENQRFNKNKENKVVYVIDNEHQYVFPNNGYFGCIIDFSRSIINPKNMSMFKDYSLPINYNIAENIEKSQALESNSLLSLYIQMFPNKLKNKEELIVLFKNHFDEVFKLLTCIDVYMITIRLTRLLENLQMKLSKKIMDLIININRMAETFITSDMNNFLAEPEKYAKIIQERDYPILSIIKKSFSEYNDGKIYGDDMGTITDIYCYSNEAKFHLDQESLFPNIFRHVKYKDNNGIIHDVKEIDEGRKNMRVSYELDKRNNLEMIQYIAQRHREKYNR